jgi:rRNA maturation endonuclease Nob1
MTRTDVRCPTCGSNVRESWVIPGKICPVCGINC